MEWRAGGYLLQICQLCLDVGHGGSPLFSFLAFFPEQRLAKSVAVRIEIDILWWGISQTESKERTPKFTDNNHHFPSFSSPHQRPQGRAILNQLQMYALSRNVPVDNWRLGLYGLQVQLLGTKFLDVHLFGTHFRSTGKSWNDSPNFVSLISLHLITHRVSLHFSQPDTGVAQWFGEVHEDVQHLLPTPGGGHAATWANEFDFWSVWFGEFFFYPFCQKKMSFLFLFLAILRVHALTGLLVLFSLGAIFHIQPTLKNQRL